MSKYFIICGMVIIVSFVCVAADATGSAKNVPVAAKDVNTVASGGLSDVVLPSEESAEYWVVRSYTVNELTSFLTKKRAELRGKLEYFKSYIEQIGKTQDMLASDIQGANDPVLRAKALGIFDELASKDITIPKKQLSWEELVEVGMKFKVSEGYSPIDVNGQELDDFKSILKRNEQFCIKVRKETLVLVDMVVKGWLYLGTIDKQKEFRLYVIDQKQQKEKAQEGKRLVSQEQHREARKQQNLTEQQNVWQEKQDARKQRYNDTRERQQRMENNYSQNGYSY
jgi:hypothetical protein